MTFDTRTLRDALGLFVTGVTVITTMTDSGEKVGITANSFNSVSLDPPLVLWSVGKTARSLAAFEAAKYFAVHILRDDQAAISQNFAKSGIDKFENVSTFPGVGDVPLLPDCAARLECSIYGRHEAGDHIIFVAEVEALVCDRQARPLVYHGGRYAELAGQA